MQAEVNLSLYLPHLIRDYTQEELNTEGCRKLSSSPQPAEAPKLLPEGKPGPQPGPMPVFKPVPQTAQLPEQPKPAETGIKPVSAIKITCSAVVSGQKPQSVPQPEPKPGPQAGPNSGPQPGKSPEQPEPAEPPKNLFLQ